MMPPFTATWMQPVLPDAAVLPWQIALAWGVLVALLCARAGRRWPWLRGVAWVAVASALLPWTRGWTSYLALAFQSPSWATLVWCALAVWPATPATRVRFTQPLAQRDGPIMAVLGVVLGWALWVDTFQRWPASWELALYAWGFSAPVLWGVCWAMLVGAVWRWRRHGALTRSQTVVGLALVAFALTRGPTGNVWDALIDPGVWFACHLIVLRALWRRGRWGA